MTKINWECPFCRHKAVVHTADHGTMSVFKHSFNQDNKYGLQVIRGEVVVCPNEECREYSLVVATFDGRMEYGNPEPGTQRQIWQLIPESDAKPFPSYIPQVILDDYREACLIRDKSPRASATLSRRALQGIIRDFWGVKKNRLVEEIEGIKDRVDVETWEAIDAVRQIGNIGAHMEKDINVIIDVEPHEAQMLIDLVETLLEESYVARHERQERMSAVKKTAAAKKAERATPKSSQPAVAAPV